MKSIFGTGVTVVVPGWLLGVGGDRRVLLKKVLGGIGILTDSYDEYQL